MNAVHPVRAMRNLWLSGIFLTQRTAGSVSAFLGRALVDGGNCGTLQMHVAVDQVQVNLDTAVHGALGHVQTSETCSAYFLLRGRR